MQKQKQEQAAVTVIPIHTFKTMNHFLWITVEWYNEEKKVTLTSTVLQKEFPSVL